MPRKKVLKIAEDKDVKAENLTDCENPSGFCETVLSVPNTEYESTRLSLLPEEVLLHIFKFLSPVDLLSLSQLSEPKITELTNSRREVNFSVCRKTSFELMSSYFSRERVKYIQKLNFSYYIFARPCDLVQVICRCKNITVLSIIECGIQYKQILKILGSCSVLKELTWNVKGTVDETDVRYSSMTKLFLLCVHPFPNNSITSLTSIIKNFPNIKRGMICFCPDYLIAPPFIGSWSKLLTISSIDPLIWFAVMVHFLNGYENGTPFFQQLQSNHLASNSREDRDMYAYLGFNSPPFLKVKTSELDISSLSSCNSATYSSVAIILTFADPDVYEKLFICISKVAGCKLKHLTFESRAYKIALDRRNWIPELLSNELYEKVSNMLQTVFFNCQNITILDIGTIHFTFSTPFKAMCHLKNLIVLNMPTCAFCKTSSNSVRPRNRICQDQCLEFEEMILKCSKVEDFHLFCCKNDIGVVRDSDIFPIQNWKKLKSFTIYSVIFRTCHFLRKIADFCQQFQSFSLIMTSPNSGCIYYDDVTYLLMNAKNLSFIRINDERFNPLFGRFMKALSSAKNLEGICFLTNLGTDFNAPSFINCIKYLKYLHLFHFYAPRVPESLYVEVRKLMDKNGIKNIKIEKECLSYFNSFGRLDCINDYHKKPSFSCKYLHLKQFLFDFFSL